MKTIICLLSSLFMFTLPNNALQVMPKKHKVKMTYVRGSEEDAFTRAGTDMTRITIMTADSVIVWKSWVAMSHNMGLGVRLPTNSGKMILKAEKEGYNTAYLNFEIKNQMSIELPTILLTKATGAKTTTMREIEVKASKVKFVWKKDTLVYDATAFNLEDGSMLRDLIKQLPGVTLSRDGQIAVNGRRVDYLLLNGRDFFKGDNKMMLDNLPYYIVKNIKVYEKLKEHDAYIGQVNAPKDYVMDVVLKREYLRGLVSNMEAGIGTNERWLARFYGMRFTDNSRLVMFANANNLNETNAPDYVGDWKMAPGMVGREQYETVNADLTFYDKQKKWENETALSTTWRQQDDYTERFTQTALQQLTTTAGSTSDNAHRQSAFELKNTFRLNKPIYIYSVTDLAYRPDKFRGTYWSATETDGLPTNTERTEELNRRHTLFLHNASSFGFNLKNDYGIWLSLDGRYQQEHTDNYQKQLITWHAASGNSLQNRFNRVRNHSYAIELESTFRKSFWYGWLSSISYAIKTDYASGHAPLFRLERDSAFSAMQSPIGTTPVLADDLLDSLNSQWTGHRGWEHTLTPYMRYTPTGSHYLIVSLPFHFRHEREDILRLPIDTVASRNYTWFSPSITYVNRARDKTWRYSFSYSCTPRQPDLIQKLPYHDDSNPLNIRIGNPDLKSEKRHTARASYEKQYRTRLSPMFNIGLSGTLTSDQITSSYTFNPQSGAYTRRPTNVNGNWQTELTAGFEHYADSAQHWRLAYNITTTWQDIAYMAADDAAQLPEKVLMHRQHVNGTLKTTYQPNSKLTLEVSGGVNFEHSTGSLSTYTDERLWNIRYGAQLQWRLPWGTQFGTNVMLYHHRGYSEPAWNNNELICNLQLSHSFLKGKPLTLKLTGYDLCGQATHKSYMLTPNGFSIVKQKGMPSYLLLSAFYKFKYK